MDIDMSYEGYPFVSRVERPISDTQHIGEWFPEIDEIGAGATKIHGGDQAICNVFIIHAGCLIELWIMRKALASLGVTMTDKPVASWKDALGYWTIKQFSPLLYCPQCPKAPQRSPRYHHISPLHMSSVYPKVKLDDLVAIQEQLRQEVVALYTLSIMPDQDRYPSLFDRYRTILSLLGESETARWVFPTVKREV